jgi:hypothetical protein
MDPNPVEVTLSLPVVEPLVAIIKSAAAALERELAAPLAMKDLEGEFRDAWGGELLAGQNSDLRMLLALFDRKFSSTGVIGFNKKNAEPIVRACSAVRLWLRANRLVGQDDEKLESGDVELAQLEEPVRKAFTCYLFLATIQELIIQHMDALAADS